MLLLLGMIALPSRAHPAQFAWPDTVENRLAAAALVARFDAELLSHDSATATLERWCADHAIASPARIVAERLPDPPSAAPPRALLRVGPAEALVYRRVRLVCGAHVLSEAENWYVPGRLTPAMNHALETTSAPFGRVVAALGYSRRRLDQRLLWSPLPEGWERSGLVAAPPGRTIDMPPEILIHRALLVLPDGTPISAVVEHYTADILAFSPPPFPLPPSGGR